MFIRKISPSTMILETIVNQSFNLVICQKPSVSFRVNFVIEISFQF